MKIAYVHSGSFPSNSPSITFTTGNAIGLANKFEQCYFFIKRNSQDNSTEILDKNFNISQPANLTVYQIQTILSSNFFYYKKVFNILKMLIEKNKLDAIITRNITFLPHLVKLHKKYAIPTYFETHDFYAELSVRTDVNYNKKRRYETIEKKYVPLISGVFCLQNSQKEWYKKLFPDQNIFVAHTGIEKIFKAPFTNRDYVTYVGSLDAHKGVEVLIKALAQTKTQPPLLIIGGKNETEKIQILKIIRNHYNSAKVQITGWVDKKEMGKYLSQTKLGIIPLQDTFFNRFLTSPLKLFDFYSYGIPVIASDLPTTRELVAEKQSGLFFKSEDAYDLAVQIDTLLSDQNLLEQMSSNVYQAAEQYLWSKRAELIFSIIESDQKTKNQKNNGSLF